LRVLDAAGFDVILVETVGVGQSEIEIVALADTTLDLLAPGMGDGIQAAKAGILEIADVFVVNKADRDGADQTARDLKYMISLGRRDRSGPLWRPPVVKTVAARMEGLDRVVEVIAEHQSWMAEHGELAERRLRRAGAEIEAIAVERMRTRFGPVDQLAKRVVEGELDPFAAAEQLISGNLLE
jgi:LAO/AO transport system kinase